ncbi:uncharacterized protein FIBRA_07831 [Fibroporia radiculosa]|uniref:HRDC domain-containing protein n=1 Tax=Fibroporia radiculosa TaxID=599839 RepID=J4GFN8_9APHY|nr:uncharacterized protein FIBRA_07831 [Fibroporia radiculosa]CCM05603.1 predicted protein [Fibroporia radiculosa]
MDQLLERADICLDEFLGRSKPPAIAVNPIQPVASKAKKSNAPQGRLDPALQHASNLPKPQLQFRHKVDNSYHTLWKPTLQHKYNAQVPLGYIFREENSEGAPALNVLHPYRYEIKHISYPSRMFTQSPPISPRSFADTPFTWVNDSAAFTNMLDKLRSAREIAVDLEHHSYRTYSGFVCLMQISTRDEDWVVDALAVRDEMEALNEVLTDPAIVKVLHGAESDIIWLQQDFNLYIVNLFDTYHASKILEFPRHSLATLLEMYCDFTADKRYQLADWRIRPLPEEMLAYARSDTHFLLFIYDNLRNALIDRAQSRPHSRSQSPSAVVTSPSSHPTNQAHALVREVLSRSEDTALRVYEKEIYDADSGAGPGGWDTLARKWNKGVLMAGAPEGGPYAVQRTIYRGVHAWRDRIAREEDESTRYVLPNHYLFVLAERPPADMAALLSLLHPVPPVIRRRSKELLDAIRAAIASVAPVSMTVAEEAKTNVLAAADGLTIADDDMQIDKNASLATNLAADSARTSLWSHVSRPPAATISSSLFGDTLVTRVNIKHTTECAAPRSALLGNAPPPRSRTSDQARFLEVVARIHGTLVIAPSVPKLAATAPSSAAGSSSGARTAPGPDSDERRTSSEKGTSADEIPFVPAAQRQQANSAVVDDSIVVVGQAKPQKRKRVGKGKGKADGSETPGAEDVMPFDYGAVSNILDEGSEPEAEEQSSRKKKLKKGAVAYQYGDFPAPPKAHSQPKSGNVSRTFR